MKIKNRLIACAPICILSGCSAIVAALMASIAVAQTPTFHGAGSAKNATTASSIMMSAPSGTVSGDVMFSQIVASCTQVGYPTRIIPPAGWAVARYDITDCQHTTDVEQAIFWRVADTADASSARQYTWNSYYWNNSSKTNSPAPGIEVGTIVSYGGVNQKYPIDDHGAWIATSPTATALSAPTVYSSTTNDALLVWYGYEVGSVNPADSPSTPAGMTLRTSLDNGGTTPDLWAGVFDQTLTSSGWTANSIGAIGSGASGESVGTAIALLPAGSTPIASAPPDPPATGITYYIDSVGGSDGNSGTSEGAPWQSIHQVNISSFQPGDHILFRTGDTWREELVPSRNGAPGNPIVYSSYTPTGMTPGPNPVISGADLLTGGWTACTNSTCGRGSAGIFYQDLTSSYILDVYVTDPTQPACPGGAECPALNGDPGWGLMRAADLPAGSGKAPGPKVNPEAGGGSAQISKMAAGSWVFYPKGTHRGPKDVTLGRLYVWLGDGSSPATHTMEAIVRDHCIGGGQPNWGADTSFITFRNLTLTHSGDGIFFYGNALQNARYITVEWDTISNLGSQVDDGSYYNGVLASLGNTWLERHNTITYTGNHGNSVNNQVMDFSIVEYDDHSHCNHDCGDTKASDLVITRYDSIHDAQLPPTGSAGTPNQYGGLYEESYSNNGRINYLGTSVSTYAAMGWEGYYDEIWNVDGGGNNSALQLDFGIGAGNLITQNTIIPDKGNAIYLGNSSTAAAGGGFIYNNIIDLTPPASSIISDTAGTWSESYNELGLYSNGTVPTATAPDISGDPQFSSGPYPISPTPPFTLASGSPCLTSGSTANGLSGAMGAQP